MGLFYFFKLFIEQSNMKKSLIFLFLIPIISWGQTKPTLNDLMWSRVQDCYSNLNEENEGENSNFEKIDDTKNGYLSISGTYPTCGCYCKSVVGAYKDKNEEYTLLQLDYNTCSWQKKISANKPLEEVLPDSFGISCFLDSDFSEKVSTPIFYLNTSIPRVGTKTKITLEVIPFGLKPKVKGAICYDYGEENSSLKSYLAVKLLVQKLTHDNSLNLIMSKRFEKLSLADLTLMEDIINDGYIDSRQELVTMLTELKDIYTLYMRLNHKSITLEWDKIKSRFFISSKGGKPEQISFKTFLLENKYWSPIC